MDSLSYETAIVIEFATSEVYEYVASLYGSMGDGWNLKFHKLTRRKDKIYNILEIELKDGKTMNYYFDITGVLGKRLLLSRNSEI